MKILEYLEKYLLNIEYIEYWIEYIYKISKNIINWISSIVQFFILLYLFSDFLKIHKNNCSINVLTKSTNNILEVFSG